MQAPDYQKAYDAARAEMDDLLGQRAVIDERLGRLKSTIDALSDLLDSPPAPEISSWYYVAKSVLAEAGVTDAIRQVLYESATPLSAPEIRKALTKSEFELEQYSNPLAVIHNTLTRLEKQGEVTRLDLPSGSVYSVPTRIKLLRKGQSIVDGIAISKERGKVFEDKK